MAAAAARPAPLRVGPPPRLLRQPGTAAPAAGVLLSECSWLLPPWSSWQQPFWGLAWPEEEHMDAPASQASSHLMMQQQQDLRGKEPPHIECRGGQAGSIPIGLSRRAEMLLGPAVGRDATHGPALCPLAADGSPHPQVTAIPMDHRHERTGPKCTRNRDVLEKSRWVSASETAATWLHNPSVLLPTAFTAVGQDPCPSPCPMSLASAASTHGMTEQMIYWFIRPTLRTSGIFFSSSSDVL